VWPAAARLPALPRIAADPYRNMGEPKVFGSNSLPGPAMYAFVTLTGNGGSLFAVGGSVMFPFSSSVADVASATRITIQSGDVTYFDAASSDCTVNLGCCGNLYYQNCSLSWN
jgi:hypothetical protein